MAIDVTIWVMTVTKTHTLPSAKEGGRWRRFEPVEAFPWNGLQSVHPKMSHIHLMNISSGPTPAEERQTFLRVKRFFEERHVDNTDPNKMVARRKFVFSEADMSARDIFNLDDQDYAGNSDAGHITMQWADVFGSMRVRDDNVRTTTRQPNAGDVL